MKKILFFSSIILGLVVIGIFAYFLSYGKSNLSKNQLLIANSYLKSPYRVLAVLKNPYVLNYIVIARERYTDGSGCGGIHSVSSCYIFLETDKSPEIPAKFITKFMGEYVSGFDDFNKTVTFKDEHTLEFHSVSGGYEVWYQIDLNSGIYKKVKEVDYEPVGE